MKKSERAASTRLDSTKERGELLGMCLERARYEYAELADNWKVLDGKAEKTIGIAGVFLAALLAFLKDAMINDGDLFAKVLATGLIVALAIALVNSFMALRIQDATMPPDPKALWDDVKPFVQDASSSAERCGQLRREWTEGQLEAWLEANADLDGKNNSKARHIASAHQAVGAAAALSALLVLTKIWPLPAPGPF